MACSIQVKIYILHIMCSIILSNTVWYDAVPYNVVLYNVVVVLGFQEESYHSL